MSKKSRKVKQPRTAFAQMWRASNDLKDIDVDYVGEPSRLALELLPQSRTIIIDPEQALAMRELTGKEMVELGEVRAPFPYTLLDFGDIRLTDFVDTIVHGVLVEDDGTGDLNGILCQRMGIGEMIMALPDMRKAGIEDELAAAFERLKDTGKVADANTTGAMRLPSIIYGILAMLESVNVELVEHPYPAGHRGAATPRYEVAIRQSSKRYRGRDDHQQIDWTHRWEVRQTFVHHRELTPEGRPNPVYAAALRDHPEKIIEVEGVSCVRVFRPAHVKGPEGLPLIPKIRHLETT